MLKNSVEQALEALRAGKFVLVTDDKQRENEADLVIACEKATEEKLAFMIKHTCGIVCVSLPSSRLQALDLPQMVARNTDPKRTAFTVTVDYKYGTTTGISPSDRAKTIQALVADQTSPIDFHRPGHIFPLQAKEGGVLIRAGHTEAALDLMRLANLKEGAAICELINDDGSVAKGESVIAFAKQHAIALLAIDDLIRYRREHETLIELVSEAIIPTDYGTFTAKVFRSKIDQVEHVALQMGEIVDPTLVRVHSECLTGDVFASRRCDCGTQLHQAMQQIQKEKRGVIVYLRGHEGRGIGLAHKLRAYQLQDKGLDTVEANESLGFPVDQREYGTGASILAELGVKQIRLLTNNPDKYTGLSGFDLDIVERVPLLSTPHADNRRYLLTKKHKLGHLI